MFLEIETLIDVDVLVEVPDLDDVHATTVVAELVRRFRQLMRGMKLTRLPGQGYEAHRPKTAAKEIIGRARIGAVPSSLTRGRNLIEPLIAC
jgi:hypothetical protein